MNIFVGIGKIVDAYSNGKVLRFNLAVKQEKSCLVPCVLFDPNTEIKKFIEHLQTRGQIVWLQGKLASYEFEHQGKKLQKVNIVAFARSIKPI
jgi:hypothetical protein